MNQFKCTRALKLIIAILFFMAVITTNLVLAPLAEATSYPITNSNIAPNGFLTIATITMFAGDTVTFNMTYSPNNNRQVDYGFIEPSGSFVSRSSTNGTMNMTITVQETGQHIIRIYNRSSVIITVNGRATHNNRVVTHNARVRYDVSYGPNNSTVISGLSNQYGNATSSIRNTFGINFVLSGDVEQSNILNGSNCGLLNIDPCIASCLPAPNNTLSRCNGNHHKSDARLNSLLQSTSRHTLRVVGHILCYWSGSHEVSVGSADIKGRNSIVSSYSPNLTATIQHELTHNLGVNNHCTNTQQCIMKPIGHSLRVMNRWCTSCSVIIWNNKH
ncbi:MAG: hypothetical protein FWD44_09685 [Oscillospiraceae bacterium]|nr:hypothetical protein [Oscillospiraceae bacterium]